MNKLREARFCTCGIEVCERDIAAASYYCPSCNARYDAEGNEVKNGVLPSITDKELRDRQAALKVPLSETPGTKEWAQAQAKAGETPTTRPGSWWNGWDEDRKEWYSRLVGGKRNYREALLGKKQGLAQTGWSVYTPPDDAIPREWLMDRFGEPVPGLKLLREDGMSRSAFTDNLSDLPPNTRPFQYVQGHCQRVPSKGSFFAVKGNLHRIWDKGPEPKDCQVAFFEGWNRNLGTDSSVIQSFEYVHWIDPCPERLTPELLEHVRTADFLTPEQKAFVLGEPVECRCGKPLDSIKHRVSGVVVWYCRSCGIPYDSDGQALPQPPQEGSLKWAQRLAKEEGAWVSTLQVNPTVPRRWNATKRQFESRRANGEWTYSHYLTGTVEDLYSWQRCPEQPGDEEKTVVCRVRLAPDDRFGGEGRYFHSPKREHFISISSTGSFNCPGYDLVAWGYKRPSGDIKWSSFYPEYSNRRCLTDYPVCACDPVYPKKVKLARRREE